MTGITHRTESPHRAVGLLLLRAPASGAEEVAVSTEVLGTNIGKGRLNRWLLKIIGPASVGSAPDRAMPAPPTDPGSVLSEPARPVP